MKTLRLVLAAFFLFLATCSDDPNAANKVTVNLVNNDSTPAETLRLYKNQDHQIVSINKCKGSPDTGDAKICTEGSSATDIDFFTITPTQGSSLPDSTVLNGFEPGFYWATFLFQDGDEDDGCVFETASGVFEIKKDQNAESTFTLTSPQSCYPQDTITCGEGQTICDDLCVSLDTDEDNCGACGNQCDSDEVCTDGTCESEI